MEMLDKGIGAEGYYPTPVHQMPFYKETFGRFNSMPSAFIANSPSSWGRVNRFHSSNTSKFNINKTFALRYWKNDI